MKLKLGETVSMILINSLASQEKLKLVNRKNLSELIDEIELGQSDLVASNSVSSIGNLLGAKIILTGSVMIVGKNKILIVCQVLEVETGCKIVQTVT